VLSQLCTPPPSHPHLTLISYASKQISQWQAFVDFENYEEASRALREKDHKVFHEKFGDRYVRLIQVCALISFV
jgi:hypothetical protein